MKVICILLGDDIKIIIAVYGNSNTGRRVPMDAK